MYHSNGDVSSGRTGWRSVTRLNDGQPMPSLGFGTSGIWDDTASQVVSSAIDAGYRLIDTAACYANERGVGEAIRNAKASGKDVFLTTKIWNSDQGFDNTLRAFEVSLKKLKTHQLNLYLIHWPMPHHDKYLATWRALIQLRSEGRVKSIGVSNFTAAHIQHLIQETGVVPAVNQIELHPRFQQRQLRNFHSEMGIATQAWSPLGTAICLKSPIVQAIASKHGCTTAQVVLCWHLDIGVFPIPKAASASHMRDNLEIANIHLDPEDHAAISELDDPAGRIGPDPDLLHIEKKPAKYFRIMKSVMKDPKNFAKRLRRFTSSR